MKCGHKVNDFTQKVLMWNVLAESAKWRKTKQMDGEKMDYMQLDTVANVNEDIFQL